MEIPPAPCRLAVRVIVKASGRLRLGTRAVIHQLLAGAAQCAFTTAQIELAGCVVAGMAGHALLREDRLHLIDIGNGSGAHAQRSQQQREGEQQAGGHGMASGIDESADSTGNDVH